MVLDDNWFVDTPDSLSRYNETRPFIRDGSYDIILATQVLLYKYSLDQKIKWSKGVADISDNIIDWVTNGNKPFNCYSNIKTARNTDIMGHVMKGIVALRLDFVNSATINNNTITNIINRSSPGINNDILQGYLDAEASQNINNKYHHLGHPKSDDVDIGYTGSYTRAISVTKSSNIEINTLTINNLISDNGTAFGIDLIRDNVQVNLNNVNISNIIASLPPSYIPKTICFNLPNWVPRAIGILIRFNNKNCNAINNSTKNIKSLIISNSLVIESSSIQCGISVGSQSHQNRERFQISDTAYDSRPII